jgi:DNA-binding MarR family transcriptional regulator
MQVLLLQFVETLDHTLKNGRGSSGIMNLTVSQLQYLDAIAELEQATVTSISERLHVTKPSATAAVSRLIELGYVRKLPSSRDGRVHILELNEAGGQLALLKEQATRDYRTFIESVLSPGEQAAFQAALQKLVEHYPQHHTREKKS